LLGVKSRIQIRKRRKRREVWTRFNTHTPFSPTLIKIFYLLLLTQ